MSHFLGLQAVHPQCLSFPHPSWPGCAVRRRLGTAASSPHREAGAAGRGSTNDGECHYFRWTPAWYTVHKVGKYYHVMPWMCLFWCDGGGGGDDVHGVVLMMMVVIVMLTVLEVLNQSVFFLIDQVLPHQTGGMLEWLWRLHLSLVPSW